MKNVLLFFGLTLYGVDPSDIQFHHTRDEITISIHDNRSQLALPATILPTEQITINIPEENTEAATAAPTMASPEWATLTRKQRIRQLCVNNKTAVIAGVATVSSATIAGIVALIVHFTAA